MAASLSQPFDSIVIPSVEQNDPESVRSSLALARSDFARGDIREALRHLRRAAEGADEAGNELRAVALARAAADLATAVGASSQAPPPVTSKEPVTGISSPPISQARSSDDAVLRQLVSEGRAVRVVIKRSTRDDDLYIVRPAPDGAPGLGMREAVIVLLEPDDGFFKPSSE
jgi:hypothetical protein